jgi:hypothetical protein
MMILSLPSLVALRSATRDGRKLSNLMTSLNISMSCTINQCKVSKGVNL